MKLDIIRKEFTDISTIGNLLIDNKLFCCTLEDKDRQIQPDGTIIPWRADLKIPKETAIPYGHYEVIIDHSTRFKKLMPHILRVPDFSGIRIHILNTAEETEGCPGIGYKKGNHCIWKSGAAFKVFFPLLEKGLKEGKVLLTVNKGE